MIREIDYIFTGKRMTFFRLMPPSLRLVNCQNSIFVERAFLETLQKGVIYLNYKVSLVSQMVKNLLAMPETWVQSLG